MVSIYSEMYKEKKTERKTFEVLAPLLKSFRGKDTPYYSQPCWLFIASIGSNTDSLF